MYRAIPHLSPIGLSVIHQADEKHVECYIPTERTTCDVLEMDIDGRMFSKFGLHDEELRNYIKVIRE